MDFFNESKCIDLHKGDKEACLCCMRQAFRINKQLKRKEYKALIHYAGKYFNLYQKYKQSGSRLMSRELQQAKEIMDFWRNCDSK